MLKNLNIIFLVFALVFALIESRQESVQSTAYTINDVTFSVSGTSNVRDWEASSSTMRGSVVFRSDAVDWSNGATGSNSEADWIQEVSLFVPANTLDSGTSALNETMYRHLREEEHPRISYRLTEVKRIEATDTPDIMNLWVTGVARAAGENHTVEHMVQLTRSQGGSITVSGEMDLKMSDFNIDPPTFLRGALVTENEFQLQFQVTLKQGT